MPPDLPNVQELNLKKRARRRLVGAVALVLLMVIILPRILQDRAALAPQEAIKITMPETSSNHQVEARAAPVAPKVENAQSPKVNSLATDASTKTEAPAVAETKSDPKSEKSSATTATSSASSAAVVEASNKISTTKNVVESQKNANKVEKKAEVKVPDVKVTESKATETKTPQHGTGSFTIQVGVYSDIANVKQLQTKLKQAGFTSHTEKITTPKGEKIRLRAGSFASRQEAASALPKLQEAGLPGMIIADE